MRLIFTARAQRRLREIQAYTAYHNVAAADLVMHRIRQTAEMLSDHPRLGRKWRGGTRALLVSGLPYRIHYRLDEAAGVVEVLTVAHTSQRPPRLDW